MSTTGTTDREAADSWDGRGAAGRLLRAATRPGAHLVSEAAALIGGSAVPADPIAGAGLRPADQPPAPAAPGADVPRQHRTLRRRWILPRLRTTAAVLGHARPYWARSHAGLPRSVVTITVT